MTRIKTTIKFDRGLHARQACFLVDMCKLAKSDIHIIKNNNEVINAKSLIAILSAGIKENEIIDIEINGEDEKKVEKDLIKFFN